MVGDGTSPEGSGRVAGPGTLPEEGEEPSDGGTQIRGHVQLGWKLKRLRAGKKQPEAARKGRTMVQRYIEREALRVDKTVTLSPGTESKTGEEGNWRVVRWLRRKVV